jgi:adenylate cyclase
MTSALDALASYLPQDRLRFLASSASLPDRTLGAALFADISGFTPLTEALALELGPKRGVEELTRHLNLIFGDLIAELERYHGSVIGFSGDAITCWLDGDNGLAATACALAMQEVMRHFAVVTTPSGAEFPLAVKVAVAAGPVRRFLVGDPHIQYWDVLVGATLDRLAAAEHHSSRGEVVVSQEVVQQTGNCLIVREWREGEEPGERFAVVEKLNCPVQAAPWQPLPSGVLTEELLRPWILPATYERVVTWQEKFQAELRPGVALFLYFTGIHYDQDETAGEKLDQFVRWVQGVASVYDGSVLQLTIGDKGSYIYIAFGAPLAHEDNVARAALTALQLRSLPDALRFITNTQIGISKGRMRVGPYGGPSRCTYGMQGSQTNMAARLMQNAPPGEVLVSLDAQEEAASAFQWEACPPLLVKGKNEPIDVFRLISTRARHANRLQEPRYTIPLVGRLAELKRIEQVMDQVQAGRGQIFAITAEAGLGKSRLVAEIIRRANSREMDVYIGECQSYGTNISYLVWRTIWQSIFDLDTDAPLIEQVRSLGLQLDKINPSLAPRLPLLGILLNLPIPDNELTHSMDAKLRKNSLEALLADVIRARARSEPLVLVLEDCHWIDALSHDLLEVIGRIIVDLPVLIVLAYRPPELEDLQAPRVTNLPYSTVVQLTDFAPEEASQLITLKLEQVGLSCRVLHPDFLNRINELAQGNPFYIEELINYLHDRGLDPNDLGSIEKLDLPTSLSSLILSRIDQLNESQKIILKVASIIGRLFRFSWLWGVDPDLGLTAQVKENLESMSRLDLTPLDQPEPEETYIFKHMVTREVAYESLPFATRSILHGNLGVFIELTYASALEQYIDLLAYHYDLSQNEAKRRLYLRKAGDAAQAAYANNSAINYYRRLLPLLQGTEQIEVMLSLGRVQETVGEWEAAGSLYEQSAQQSDLVGDRLLHARSEMAGGHLKRKQGEFDVAVERLELARAEFEASSNLASAGEALAEIGEVYRLKGDYAQAGQCYQRSLMKINAVEDELVRNRARAGVLKSLGTLANQQGDSAQARKMYEESLSIRRSLGEKMGVAVLLNNLGMVAMFEEDYASAQPLFSESLSILREIGDRWAIGQLLNNLGLVLRYLGDTAAARQMLEESIATRRALGDKWGIANSLSSLTNLLIHLGQYQGVWAMVQESLLINIELGDKIAIAYCLEDFAGLAAGEGQPERALILAGAAAALREEIGGPLPAGEQAALDQTLAPARQAMTQAEQEKAWQTGQAMSLEAALSYALASA